MGKYDGLYIRGIHYSFDERDEERYNTESYREHVDVGEIIKERGIEEGVRGKDLRHFWDNRDEYQNILSPRTLSKVFLYFLSQDNIDASFCEKDIYEYLVAEGMKSVYSTEELWIIKKYFRIFFENLKATEQIKKFGIPKSLAQELSEEEAILVTLQQKIDDDDLFVALDNCKGDKSRCELLHEIYSKPEEERGAYKQFNPVEALRYMTYSRNVKGLGYLLEDAIEYVKEKRAGRGWLGRYLSEHSVCGLRYRETIAETTLGKLVSLGLLNSPWVVSEINRQGTQKFHTQIVQGLKVACTIGCRIGYTLCIEGLCEIEGIRGILQKCLNAEYTGEILMPRLYKGEKVEIPFDKEALALYIDIYAKHKNLLEFDYVDDFLYKGFDAMSWDEELHRISDIVSTPLTDKVLVSVDSQTRLEILDKMKLYGEDEKEGWEYRLMSEAIRLYPLTSLEDTQEETK